MTNLLDSLAKPPPPPSELDELMARDPLDLSAQDIDKIIAFQRQARARRESGGKVRKAADEKAVSSIDMAALVRGIVGQAATPKPAPTITKPGVGFRRI